MVAMSKLVVGQTLWTVTRQKMGNTTMSQIVYHPVTVKEVHETHVVASWNYNAPKKFYRGAVAKWRLNKPVKKGAI